MARDNVFLTYVIVDLLFVVSGALIISFALTTQTYMTAAPTVNSIAKDLLFRDISISAAIGNAVLIFVTFLFTIPGMILPTNRGWLKFSGYMIVVCAIFTLVLGLEIWVHTLRTRETLLPVWMALPASSQSLLQQEFNCCGYTNSTSPPFVVDSTCPNTLAAAATVGCVTPFSRLGNDFLPLIFTAAFGMVGVDVILIMATAMLLKDRKEKERYRHIDEKNGTGAF